MPITFSCPCGRVLRAADEHAGRDSKCPVCGRALTVPEADVPAPTRLVADEDAAYRTLGEDDSPAAPRRPVLRGDDEPAAALPAGDAWARKSTPDAGTPARPRLRTEVPDRSSPPFAGGRSILTGILMMVGAAAWFLVGMAAHRFFIYPIILFVMGFLAVVKGVIGNAE
jgi:hypothetical protein